MILIDEKEFEDYMEDAIKGLNFDAIDDDDNEAEDETEQWESL